MAVTDTVNGEGHPDNEVESLQNEVKEVSILVIQDTPNPRY